MKRLLGVFLLLLAGCGSVPGASSPLEPGIYRGESRCVEETVTGGVLTDRFVTTDDRVVESAVGCRND